jgi:hypothetical protein
VCQLLEHQRAQQLHTLGRWFERTGCREHTALVCDLAVLDRADDVGERVATPVRGAWLGSVLTLDESDGVTAQARSVQTKVDGWIGRGTQMLARSRSARQVRAHEKLVQRAA